MYPLSKKNKGIILLKYFIVYLRWTLCVMDLLNQLKFSNIYFISNELLRILWMNTCTVNFQKLKTVILNFEYDILSSLLIYQRIHYILNLWVLCSWCCALWSVTMVNICHLGNYLPYSTTGCQIRVPKRCSCKYV